MSKKITDLETRKSIHFNISTESHSHLRMSCFKYRLSMQEVFEALSIKIAEESPDMIDFMEDLAFNKKHKIIKKLSETDAESLFNAIESKNPLSEK